MPRGLPISTTVQISASISAGGVMRTDFGLGLLIGLSDALSASGTGKMAFYTDIESVVDAGHDGETLAAARVWFSADPPPQGLYIGRWAPTDVNTRLIGSAPTVAANAAPLNSATGSIRINGVNVTGINLSSATTHTAIATILQTSIRAASGLTGFGSATVTYDTTGNNGQGAYVLDVGGITAIMGGSVLNAVNTDDPPVQQGADISVALGWRNPTTYLEGTAAETLTEAIGDMIPLATSGAPVLIMLDGSAPAAVGGVDSREALAGFVNAGQYFAFIRDNDSDTLETNEQDSFSSYVFENQLSKVEPILGNTEINFGAGTNYVDVAANALLSAQRLNLPQQIITTHLKVLPGATARRIDAGQLAELTRKRTSAYGVIAGLPSLIGGFAGRAGVWADAQYWLLWVQNELELAIFNAQRAARRFNTVILTDTILQVMDTVVQSGGLLPGGRVNAPMRFEISQVVGNPDFDGILPTGFFLWVEGPNQRTDLDRENRIGRFSIWMTPADAIHDVVGTVRLSGG